MRGWKGKGEHAKKRRVCPYEDGGELEIQESGERIRLLPGLLA